MCICIRVMIMPHSQFAVVQNEQKSLHEQTNAQLHVANKKWVGLAAEFLHKTTCMCYRLSCRCNTCMM